MPEPGFHRRFAPLAGANLAAQAAEQISLAAVPLVAVLRLGAGPAEVGLLATVQTLPFLLLSIPAGLLADRVSRRRLMLAAELLRLGSFALTVMALLMGWASVAVLALLGFAGATGTVAFSVAAPALVGTLVAREDLGRANRALELARSLAFTAGPALAGSLVGWAGAPSAFVLATVLTTLAFALLVRVREPARTPAPPRHVVTELHEGLAFVWSHALLRPILLTGVMWNLGWFVLQAVFVPHAVQTLGLDAGAIGWTMAAYGAGMVVGALLSTALLRRMDYGHAILLGPAMSAVASLLMAATAWWAAGSLAALAFLGFGIGPIVWTICTTTLRQVLTPDALLGRVTAVFYTTNFGARPLGAALGGLAGESFGLAAALALSSVAFAVQLLIIAASPVRRLRRLPQPEPEPAPVAGSGPVKA